MKECRTIRELLSSLLDNAVTSGERHRIETHLAACPRCREALRELQRTVALLQNQGEVEPPPWLTTRIMARIADEPAPQRSFWERLFQPWPVKIPLQALALLTLCVTGYLLTHENIRQVEFPAPAREQIASHPAAPAPAREDAPATIFPKTRAESRPIPATPSVTTQQLPATVPAPSRPGQESPPTADVAPAPPASAPSKMDGASKFRETPSEPAATGKALRAPAAERTLEMRSAPRSLMDHPAATIKSGAAKDETYGTSNAVAPATLRLIPLDPATAGQAIIDLARQSGGTIQASSTGYIKILLPTNRYYDLLRGLSRLGTLPAEPPVPATESQYQQIIVVW